MVASLTLICMKLVPWDPNTLLLVTGLLKRYQKVQIPCFLLFLCYKLLDVKKRIHKRMSILFQFSSGTWGPRIATKFTIPRESGPLQEKLWYSLAWKWMSFMEFELSDIFPLKLVANKKMLGSPWTQCWAISGVWCLLWKKHANVLSKTVRFFQYTFFYVKKLYWFNLCQSKFIQNQF